MLFQHWKTMTETMSVIEPEMDKTENHEETVVERNSSPGAGSQSLQEVLPNVYVFEEPVKESFDCQINRLL